MYPASYIGTVALEEQLTTYALSCQVLAVSYVPGQHSRFKFQRINECNGL